MTPIVQYFCDSPTPLAILVGILVGVICLCTVAAISLAVVHYNENAQANTKFSIKERTNANVPQAPPKSPGTAGLDLHHVPSAASMFCKGAIASHPLVACDHLNSRAAGRRRHRSNSCSSPVASIQDQIELSSIFDTQDTMDSAMVQEILGSVDANHVRETQVLLHSFNWDLHELLHQEVCQGKGS